MPRKLEKWPLVLQRESWLAEEKWMKENALISIRSSSACLIHALIGQMWPKLFGSPCSRPSQPWKWKWTFIAGVQKCKITLFAPPSSTDLVLVHLQVSSSTAISEIFLCHTQSILKHKKDWKSLRNLLFGSSLYKDFERNMSWLLNEFFTTMHPAGVSCNFSDEPRWFESKYYAEENT